MKRILLWFAGLVGIAFVILLIMFLWSPTKTITNTVTVDVPVDTTAVAPDMPTQMASDSSSDQSFNGNVPHKASSPDGKIIFDWPSQMEVDRSYLLHLVIACNMPLNYLEGAVDSLVVVDTDTTGQYRRRRVKANVQLVPHMQASLQGASDKDPNVTISRPPNDDGSRTINLATDTSVVWSWNVTPRKAGPLRLIMYLTRLDQHDSRPIDVQTILVKGIEPSFFDKVTNLLTKANALWGLLSTGVVASLATYLWKRFIAKPSEQQKST